MTLILRRAWLTTQDSLTSSSRELSKLLSQRILISDQMSSLSSFHLVHRRFMLIVVDRQKIRQPIRAAHPSGSSKYFQLHTQTAPRCIFQHPLIPKPARSASQIAGFHLFIFFSIKHFNNVAYTDNTLIWVSREPSHNEPAKRRYSFRRLQFSIHSRSLSQNFSTHSKASSNLWSLSSRIRRRCSIQIGFVADGKCRVKRSVDWPAVHGRQKCIFRHLKEGTTTNWSTF